MKPKPNLFTAPTHSRCFSIATDRLDYHEAITAISTFIYSTQSSKASLCISLGLLSTLFIIPFLCPELTLCWSPLSCSPTLPFSHSLSFSRLLSSTHFFIFSSLQRLLYSHTCSLTDIILNSDSLQSLRISCFPPPCPHRSSHMFFVQSETHSNTHTHIHIHTGHTATHFSTWNNLATFLLYFSN